MMVTLVAAPHPATLPIEQLQEQCELRTQRRSGPGGQHRNKTSSAAFLLHKPSEIVAEATERRSQAENRNVAIQRLRFRLAIQLRTASAFDVRDVPGESEIRQQFHGKSLRLSEANQAKPAVLALVLNDLHAAGGQPSLVAPLWDVSTSAIVGLIKSHAPAFVLVNQIRAHHDRSPLK